MNLRGEYHVDNVTTYDQTPSRAPDSPERMDLDADGAKQPDSAEQSQITPSDMDLTQTSDTGQSMKDTKAVKFESNVNHEEKDKKTTVLGTDKLYPMFWSLQQYFSTPTIIFDSANLKAFKSALEATLSKFKEVERDSDARGGSKPPEEGRHGIKRKRGSAGGEMASSFNPKYLTSRDLFELEVRSHTTIAIPERLTTSRLVT